MLLIIIYKRYIKIESCDIKQLDFAFFGCSSLTDLSGISEWITSNIISMKYIFYNCNNLSQKTEISKWKNLKNINEMTITYNLKTTRIRLFGQKFVENNKNKCYLLIKNHFLIRLKYKLNLITLLY